MAKLRWHKQNLKTHQRLYFPPPKPRRNTGNRRKELADENSTAFLKWGRRAWYDV